MKTIVAGAAFALTLMSWSAMAEEQAPDHAKAATMEEKCRAMGEQHGMKDDKMDAWMKKCMEIVKKMNEDMNNEDNGDAPNSQDGDKGMGGKE